MSNTTQQWRFGFSNSQGCYLTAESFGCRVNANATSMKRKQIWVVEQDPAKPGVVMLKAHTEMYVAAPDNRGTLTCDTESCGGQGGIVDFRLEYADDGRWAFKNTASGYYLGGRADNIRCYEKKAGDSELWTPHLATHPQVNLRSVSRKTYARTTDDSLCFNEIIPWGEDALINLEYSSGRYAIRAFDGRYSNKDGQLVAVPDNKCYYTLEIYDSGFALKDFNGHFMTSMGKEGLLKARQTKTSLSRDDVFTMEDSQIQCYLTAVHNGRFVSVKQGVDISANQVELEDTEIFQVEFVAEAKRSGQPEVPETRVRLRTCSNNLWSVDTSTSGVQSKTNPGQNAQFTFSLEWMDNGEVAVKASNGKYICSRPNGSLYATSNDSSSKDSRFRFGIVNRPRLILGCDHGFLGCKKGGDSLQCNLPKYEAFTLEHTSGAKETHRIKGANGMYWTVCSDGSITTDSQQATEYRVEIRQHSKVCIRTATGEYISGEQNGLVRAKSDELTANCYWEC